MYKVIGPIFYLNGSMAQLARAPTLPSQLLHLDCTTLNPDIKKRVLRCPASPDWPQVNLLLYINTYERCEGLDR